jgi:membrane-associated PAP2 superfamily phosphatase
LAALLLVVGWDVWGQDMAVAQWFGTPTGFALRNHWFWVQVMHELTRSAGWLLVVLLALAVWWPVGFLRNLHTGARLQMVVSTLLALLAVSLFKAASNSSCPWDLTAFGGLARYTSHWAWGVADGGSGRCFPAGHASAGFAFVGGYFALRPTAPAIARRWLAGALLAGLVLGLSQQVRGAHFMSHTLWTGWVCWAVGWACDALARRQRWFLSQKRVMP